MKKQSGGLFFVAKSAAAMPQGRKTRGVAEVAVSLRAGQRKSAENPMFYWVFSTFSFFAKTKIVGKIRENNRVYGCQIGCQITLLVSDGCHLPLRKKAPTVRSMLFPYSISPFTLSRNCSRVIIPLPSIRNRSLTRSTVPAAVPSIYENTSPPRIEPW